MSNESEKSVSEMTMNELRDAGYAVIVWTPEELRGASARRVEDRSIELGWEVIDLLASE